LLSTGVSVHSFSTATDEKNLALLSLQGLMRALQGWVVWTRTTIVVERKVHTDVRCESLTAVYAKRPIPVMHTASWR
jgi:hypothetical protein